MVLNKSWGIAALACTIFESALVTANGQSTSGPWTIAYQTGALTVEAVEQSASPQPFTVTLRNTSPRSISAIGLSIGPHDTWTQVDLAPNAHDLAPGATYRLRLRTQPQDLSGSLRVAAVLFSDGGGDGDPVVLQTLRFSRLGQMLESARFLGLLQGPGPLRADDTSVGRIRQSLGPPPNSAEEAIAGYTIPLATQQMLREATTTALDAFKAGVALRRASCQMPLDILTNIPASSSARRVQYLSNLRAQYQGTANALSTAWSRDMVEGEQ